MRCSQWWHKTTTMTDYLVDEIDEQLIDNLYDNETLGGIKDEEIKELDEGLNKLIRQWLIRNKRIPNGVYFEEEIIYKVKDGKAVRIGKSE